MSYSDEEQIENIRRWWEDNGRSVIAGVVIAIAGVGGWQGWNVWQDRQAASASTHFEATVNALEAERLAQAREQLGELHASHSGSSYATLATLRVAAALADNESLDEAAAALRWAVSNAPDDGLKRLARLRHAQVLFDLGDARQALDVLEPIDEGSYAARAFELRGDLLHSLGERDHAVEAYRRAISANPADGRRGLLDAKLADLGASAQGSS